MQDVERQDVRYRRRTRELPAVAGRRGEIARVGRCALA